jgi:hypothetical protein
LIPYLGNGAAARQKKHDGKKPPGPDIHFTDCFLAHID